MMLLGYDGSCGVTMESWSDGSCGVTSVAWCYGSCGIASVIWCDDSCVVIWVGCYMIGVTVAVVLLEWFVAWLV